MIRTLAFSAALFLLANSAFADAAADRQVEAPCEVVAERAKKYLDDHDLDARGSAQADGSFDISLINHKAASVPTGKPLRLNRYTISKYTQPKHLSVMKSYKNFASPGHLILSRLTDSSCELNLGFEFRAYEYVWALAAIDDGQPTKFVSNGVLEELYLDAVVNLFTTATR